MFESRRAHGLLKPILWHPRGTYERYSYFVLSLRLPPEPVASATRPTHGSGPTNGSLLPRRRATLISFSMPVVRRFRTLRNTRRCQLPRAPRVVEGEESLDCVSCSRAFAPLLPAISYLGSLSCRSRLAVVASARSPREGAGVCISWRKLIDTRSVVASAKALLPPAAQVR
jgi:hypothetical protein